MTTTETHLIYAGQLRPGDVVLKIDGTRLYAAFDVEHDVQRLPSDPPRTRIHTADRDQKAGWPASFNLLSSHLLTVERRVDGPRVTHTTIAVPYDDRPFPYVAKDPTK